MNYKNFKIELMVFDACIRYSNLTPQDLADYRQILKEGKG